MANFSLDDIDVIKKEILNKVTNDIEVNTALSSMGVLPQYSIYKVNLLCLFLDCFDNYTIFTDEQKEKLINNYNQFLIYD